MSPRDHKVIVFWLLGAVLWLVLRWHDMTGAAIGVALFLLGLALWGLMGGKHGR